MLCGKANRSRPRRCTGRLWNSTATSPGPPTPCTTPARPSRRHSPDDPGIGPASRNRSNQFLKMRIVGGVSRRRFVAARRQNATKIGDGSRLPQRGQKGDGGDCRGKRLDSPVFLGGNLLRPPPRRDFAVVLKPKQERWKSPEICYTNAWLAAVRGRLPLSLPCNSLPPLCKGKKRCAY